MLIVAALRDRKLIALWGMKMKMVHMMTEDGECSERHGGRSGWLWRKVTFDEKSRLCRDASFGLIWRVLNFFIGNSSTTPTKHFNLTESHSLSSFLSY